MNHSSKTNPNDLSDTALTETELSSQIVYDGHFFKVRKDQVSLPDGHITTREYIRHPGAVVILPLFDDGTVLLERQFRYPLKRIFTEFPAGKIDPGEDPLTSAKRELEEETGYTASDWQFVTAIHNAIGYSDEQLSIYLARNLKAGSTRLDDGEFIQTFKIPLTELLYWVKTGEISDVKTVIGAFWLEKIATGQWKAEKIV